ncbi:MAG: hypothetical protein ABII64_05455 [Elusimicrobiota bacterium]
MKKVLLLVIAVSLAAAMSSFAASSISRSTFTASVDFSTFQGVTYINVALKNIYSGANASQFSFTPSAGALGIGTTWYTANEYAVIFTTWTKDNVGRVLIYTDNTAADANPKYAGAGNAAGLVCSTSTVSGDDPINLCWRATDVSTTTYKIGWYLQGTAMKLYGLGLSQDYYCFLWMKDKGSDGNWYNVDNGYASIKSFDNSGSWLQHAESQLGTTASPDYFYLGANLEKAKAGRTYKTSTLRFDLVMD